MSDVRLRWLLGIHPRRTKLGAATLGALAVLGLALALVDPPSPRSAGALLLVAVLPLAGVLYAGWNGGPLLATLATLAMPLLMASQSLDGARGQGYALIALPAGLVAFGLGAWRAHRVFHGPPPLGEGRGARALLVLWFLAVFVLAAVAATIPEQRLGPRITTDAPWAPWVRAIVLWGPAGLALAWAVLRRGPVLVFCLATVHLWAGYLAAWAGAAARNPGALYVGELLLPPPLDAMRGAAAILLGLLALGLALAFEPAWPWMPYRKEDAAMHQV